jgi:para-aminobenzoate synthetase component 1
MLELWSPEDAFEAIERYLRDHGFFDGGEDGRVADLYLGYGLSRTSRRTATPDPPEPCALPLAACRIRPSFDAPVAAGSFRVGEWRTTWSPNQYAHAIESVRDAIGAGEVYQVNIVQHLSAPFRGDPMGLAGALRPLNPLHGRPLQGDGWTIVSASPELFLGKRGDRVWTMPIKGTRPAGSVGDLQASAKDAAEHVMIVDLERNDLGRVCIPGSVRWPEVMVPRHMAGVEHLVSTVEGRIDPSVSLAGLLVSMFPGGSVTGAPKVAAIDHIARLEPVGRGASMGALGVVYPNGDLDLALTIRTFAIDHDRIHLWVGGGVVWDSRSEDEIEEAWVKARPLLTAISSELRPLVTA